MQLKFTAAKTWLCIRASSKTAAPEVCSQNYIAISPIIRPTVVVSDIYGSISKNETAYHCWVNHTTHSTLSHNPKRIVETWNTVYFLSFCGLDFLFLDLFLLRRWRGLFFDRVSFNRWNNSHFELLRIFVGSQNRTSGIWQITTKPLSREFFHVN